MFSCCNNNKQDVLNRYEEAIQWAAKTEGEQPILAKDRNKKYVLWTSGGWGSFCTLTKLIFKIREFFGSHSKWDFFRVGIRRCNLQPSKFEQLPNELGAHILTFATAKDLTKTNGINAEFDQLSKAKLDNRLKPIVEAFTDSFSTFKDMPRTQTLQWLQVDQGIEPQAKSTCIYGRFEKIEKDNTEDPITKVTISDKVVKNDADFVIETIVKGEKVKKSGGSGISSISDMSSTDIYAPWIYTVEGLTITHLNKNLSEEQITLLKKGQDVLTKLFKQNIA